MPVSEYFRGKGKKVMKSLKSQYGDEKGEHVFYALSNRKSGMKPKGSLKSSVKSSLKSVSRKRV